MELATDQGKTVDLNLRLFDLNTNVTTDAGLSVENKTFYEKTLIAMAEPKLVHDQFGQKKDIPKGGGKTIEFRKFAPLPKLLTPLEESVTPDGQKISVSAITAQVHQYGGYVPVSDVLELTAIDPIITETTKMIGGQSGRSLDTITREVLAGGTNVQYGAGAKFARHQLVGGEQAGNDTLTVDAIKRAVRALKVMNAEPIGESFVAIVHPDVTYDLTSDPEWKYPHQYVDTENLYSGEIGKVAGVRFVETTEAKVVKAKNLATDARNLTVNGAATGTTTVTFDGGSVAASALVGRKVLIGETLATVTANTTTTLTLDTAVTAADNAVIYPGEAGAKGRDVYVTLVLGDNAYGVTSIEGGGLEHIFKPRGSGGTSDPLNQRSTIGWKGMKTAVRLVEEYMVRIETCSSLTDAPAN